MAIVFAGKAMTDISTGLADASSRGRAQAGRICGIIGLVLSLINMAVGVLNLVRGGGVYRFNF